jgi:hypothetical protein
MNESDLPLLLPDVEHYEPTGTEPTNSVGFMTKEPITVTYYYFTRYWRITTEVESHEETRDGSSLMVKGGSISGEGETPYEFVVKGSSSTKQIVLTPENGYMIRNVTINGEELERIVLEFDERKTKEAIFAYQCDKLECDIQAKLYDEEHCVDLDKQKDNATFYNPNVNKLLDRGLTWGQMWLEFGRDRYPYDDNFMNVSKYVEDNDIYNGSNYIC